MRFDISYAHAKTMATRLQAFLAENPKPTLSRSSSIEAVAKLLGFNNRNEMAARLTQSGEEAVPVVSKAPPTAAENLSSALEAFLKEERITCARSVVDKTREISPDQDFWDAVHVDGPEGIHSLICVEDKIIDRVDSDPEYRRFLHAALLSSEEFESALEEHPSIPRALAKGLVNEALPLAESMWSDATDYKEGDH